MSSAKSHIGIIGAGVSGLRCAVVLLNHGFKVTILEARDRVGGRICQSDKLGYRVDIGPNWIHQSSSEGRHPIIGLAKKTNIPLHTWNDKQNIFDSNGKLIPSDIADTLSTTLWQFIEEAFADSLANGDRVHEFASLFDYIKTRVTEDVANEENRKLLLQMAQMWGAYVGDEVTKQSLRFAWLEQCCGGDGEMFVESTWEGILEEMSRVPLEKAQVFLNDKVIHVQCSERNLEGAKVTVNTNTDRIFEFDEVVMTTPLGWLKQNQTIFEPALPQKTLEAIDNISVGHLEKVYITFATAFWISSQSWSSKPLPPDLTPQQRAEAEDTFPGYTNWLSPNYAPETNPSKWPIECWNLASFTPPNRHPTLIFYLYGPCSHHLINLVHQKSSSEHDELLNNFFKPYYSLLPNYNASSIDCQPKAILSTEWQKDELAGYGSYCNFQVGIQDAASDLEALRKGVPERRLWFAGEHTAPVEELGTVAGAYLSGESVAVKIGREYGIDVRVG